jgi:L-fucose isomerase
MACEADGDGALTMQMLKEVSGGGATLFADVSHMNTTSNTLYLPNCGGMCSWFAGRSACPKDNMKNIELRPSVRPGGGAITYFTAAPGPITLARLYRHAGQYRMAIIPGEVIELPKKELDDFVAERGKHQLPIAFVKVGCDLTRFVDEFGSNHISGVAGTYINELTHLCDMIGITPVIMDADY